VHSRWRKCVLAARPDNCGHLFGGWGGCWAQLFGWGAGAVVLVVARLSRATRRAPGVVQQAVVLVVARPCRAARPRVVAAGVG
jgi:hypothetical protein